MTRAIVISKNNKVVFDFAVVDEAQDIASPTSGSLPPLVEVGLTLFFFAGDLGQRIFQQPFSWKTLDVGIRGRSRTLRVNYRTSHQIRTLADHLLGPVVTDVESNREDRSDTRLCARIAPWFGEYLTEKEIERLQEAARRRSRYGHRDATMILSHTATDCVPRNCMAFVGIKLTSIAADCMSAVPKAGSITFIL